MAKLILKNQFGEESINDVLSGSGVGPEPTKTVMANDTGGTAAPTAVAYANFSQHLPAKTGVTAISAIATADATDLPTAVALANATKAAFNSLLAALKAIT